MTQLFTPSQSAEIDDRIVQIIVAVLRKEAPHVVAA